MEKFVLAYREYSGGYEAFVPGTSDHYSLTLHSTDTALGLYNWLRDTAAGLRVRGGTASPNAFDALADKLREEHSTEWTVLLVKHSSPSVIHVLHFTVMTPDEAHDRAIQWNLGNGSDYIVTDLVLKGKQYPMTLDN